MSVASSTVKYRLRQAVSQLAKELTELPAPRTAAASSNVV
jgi:hypothetical protein